VPDGLEQLSHSNSVRRFHEKNFAKHFTYCQTRLNGYVFLGYTALDEEDEIWGEDGKDQIRAGSGKDYIDTGRYRGLFRNGEGYVDTVDCGSGSDTVYFEKGRDKINANCEIKRPYR
jgi:hypothetical protein